MDKALSIRSTRSICQMEKFPINSTVRSSIGQLHVISDNGDPVHDCRIDPFVRLVGMVIFILDFTLKICRTGGYT